MEAQALKQESPEWVRLAEGMTNNGSPVSSFQPELLSEVKDSGVSTREKTLFDPRDRVSLSDQAKSLQAKSLQAESVKQDAQLTPNDQEFLTRLKARDNEVKAHEAAHLASAGQYATSSASYTYQEGPNGKQYAIGGEVGIDVSPVANDPEATITKADTIVQAALSPASPSPQDFKVADQARQMRMQAARELAIKENQDQQAERYDSAVQVDEKIKETQAQKSEEQRVESEKEALKQTENKQEDVKAEMERLQMNQKIGDTTGSTKTDVANPLLSFGGQSAAQTEQDKERAKEQEDKRAKEEADRLASLNQLFARYDEARKTYQAIVDFFTNQYEQSKKGQSRIELFA